MITNEDQAAPAATEETTPETPAEPETDKGQEDGS